MKQETRGKLDEIFAKNENEYDDRTGDRISLKQPGLHKVFQIDIFRMSIFGQFTLHNKAL